MSNQSEKRPRYSYLPHQDRLKIPPFASNQGDELAFLLQELDRSQYLPTLLENGIDSIETLKQRKETLENLPIKAAVKKSLVSFCEWHDDFYDHNSDSVVWQDHFSEDALEAFGSRRSPEEILSLVVYTLHQEKRDLSNISRDDFQRMVDYTSVKIVDALPANFKLQCHFDIKEYVAQWINAIVDMPFAQDVPNIKPDLYLAFGRTQAGKSVLKAVLWTVCDELGIDLFIITKGVAESKDLLKKIELYLDDSKHRRNSTGATLRVVADTGRQIRRLVNLVSKDRADKKKQGLTRKFVVVADECDAYLRTEHGSQVMEQAYNDLMKLGAALRIEISATLVPSLIAFVLERNLQVELLQIGTSEDYAGIEHMKPFELARQSVFLSATKEEIRNFKLGVEASGKSGRNDVDTTPLFEKDDFGAVLDEEDEDGRFDGAASLPYIPYTNEDTLAFYRAAASSDGKGVLLLDITNPRVNVIDNIFVKAAAVQDMFHAETIDAIIVVHVASGIFVRRPNFQQGRRIKGASMSDVIEQLDKEFGLEIPILLFGYSKMRRCISHRSTQRVPTHVLLSLGKGHSIENFVQALGRGTFNGLESVLKSNGHDCVTILADKEDLTAAQKYIQFLEYLVDQINKGNTLDAAFAGASGKFPDSTNFLRHSDRKIGLRKDFRERFRDADIFEELEDDDDEEEEYEAYQGDILLRQKYAQNTTALRILNAWENLKDGTAKTLSPSVIRRTFLNFYHEDGHGISLEDVTSIMKDFEKDEIVAQKRRGWKVVNWKEAMYLIQNLPD